MKKFLALALAFMMIMSLVACGSKDTPTDNSGDQQDNTPSADSITISVCNAYSDLDQINVELKAAADRISERTNGAVTVNVYPNNTFGDPNVWVDATNADSPIISVASFPTWHDMYPDADALQAGFVWEYPEEIIRFYDTDLCKQIIATLDEQNIHTLNAPIAAGMRHVIGRKSYATPEEIKGLKLRTVNGAAWLDCFTAMGASPMGMASSEQLSALSAGTIDALDQSISLIYSTKSYELVKDVTLLAQQPLWDGLYCSTKWWNSLPADYQEIIEDELHTATVNYSNYCVENEASMREELEAAGVVFHEADREAFAEMTKSVLDKYSISTELLETVAQIRADIAAGK